MIFVPEGATILGFADDLTVVVTANHSEDVEVYTTEAVRVVKSCLESRVDTGRLENGSGFTNEPEKEVYCEGGNQWTNGRLKVGYKISGGDDWHQTRF